MEYNNLFEHSHFIGYVNQVNATNVNVHFPSSTLLQSFFYKGENFNGGLVGNFVVIEGENYGFLAKILELNLPEKERLELSEKSFKNDDFHPIGKVEILMSFDIFNPHNIEKGLNTLPVIGAKVFVCSSDFIKSYFKNFGVKEENIGKSPVFELGKLTHDHSCTVEVSQQALFGRHCAIVGTTGGGKSYTVSNLLQGASSKNGKTILIDSTGEFENYDKQEFSFPSSALNDTVFFHYSNLTTEDLLILLKPSGQVQAPKLMEAIKSLKILNILESKHEIDDTITKNDDGSFSILISETGSSEKIFIDSNNIIKAQKLMRPINRVYNKYIKEIETLESNFDFKSLGMQIIRECVYDVDWDDSNKWGKASDSHRNNCISLILRINNIVNNPLFEKTFGFNQNKESENELKNQINSFIKSDKRILRISFQNVGYELQIREIIANALGRFLLGKARVGDFKKSPIVLFIDEAHQYLNKSVKDEYFEQTSLNSIDTIAKECRKYGLFLCISTQMPRDIPVGTLSQIGTFIVHRLINHYDKEAIANASSSANRSTLDFLPILGAGEAILIGVDFPMPVMLKINMPKVKPNSDTPQFI